MASRRHAFTLLHESGLRVRVYVEQHYVTRETIGGRVQTAPTFATMATDAEQPVEQQPDGSYLVYTDLGSVRMVRDESQAR